MARLARATAAALLATCMLAVARAEPQACPVGEFSQDGGQTCFKCSDEDNGGNGGCTECLWAESGALLCSKCEPIGFTFDAGLAYCMACGPGCLSCEIEDGNKCTSCVDRHTFQPTTKTCTPDADACLSLRPGCSVCSPLDPTECLVCDDGYGLGYDDDGAAICRACDPASNCLTCHDGDFVASEISIWCSACKTDRPYAHNTEGEDADGICYPCGEQCAECRWDAPTLSTVCTRCVDEATQELSTLDLSTCVARGSQRPCSVKGCKQCVEGDATTCETCEGTKALGGEPLGTTCVCPEGQEDDGTGGCTAGSGCAQDGSGNCLQQTTRWQELAGGGCDDMCARCEGGVCRECLEPNLHVVDRRSGKCRRKTCADRYPGCKACGRKGCERCARGWKPHRGGCRRLPRCLSTTRHCVRCARNNQSHCGACRRGYRLRKSGQCVRAGQR